MTRRRVRHCCLAAFVLMACGLAYALMGRRGPTGVAISLGSGYASLALLLLALLVGPWTVVSGGRMSANTMFRRDVGIWAALSGGLHVVFGLQSHFGGQVARYFFSNQVGRDPSALLFVTTNWIGAAATLILLGLLLLSNDRSLRGLGTRRWKSLQRLAYPLAALTILHTFGYQLVENRGGTAIVLTGAVAAAVTAVQLVGFSRVRQRSSVERDPRSVPRA